VTTVRHAVIDVGTNSVKLLVGEVGSGGVQPLLEQSEQTRLGRGFYETHLLLSEAIAHTAEAVAKFAKLAREHRAASIRVIATSAARDAVNRATLLQAIEKASDLKVEIISGEDEAQLVFRGVATAPELQGHKLLILDVGGGSTEFILGEGKHHQFRKSFDLGTVRLIEKLRPADPPGVEELKNCRNRLHELFIEQIGPAVQPALGDPATLTLVGTGGTTTILARTEKGLSGFNRHEIEGTIIGHERVVYWLERLWTLSLAERRQIVGIPGNRADIVTMGLAIYEGVMDYFGFRELFVSTRGLRFGALMQADD
jgi:exopolyphosphatase/guanosine-5'-triphosphate,3'-diphosphate pyrophosphatase